MRPIKTNNGFTVRELEYLALIPYGAENARTRANIARGLGLDPTKKSDMRAFDELTASCREKGLPICASKRAPFGLYFPNSKDERVKATAHFKAEIIKYKKWVKVLENEPVPQATGGITC